MNVLIIEDERKAANRLVEMLKDLEKEIVILSVLDSIESAVSYLTTNPPPDLIFLDIELGDGQSFAIAGLLRDNMRETVQKFPVLGDIPVLGALFRSSRYQKNQTELLIIVTPHYVKPMDVAQLPLPTDTFVEPNDWEFYLMGWTDGLGYASPAKRLRDGRYAEAAVSGRLDGNFGHMVQ